MARVYVKNKTGQMFIILLGMASLITTTVNPQNKAIIIQFGSSHEETSCDASCMWGTLCLPSMGLVKISISFVRLVLTKRIRIRIGI